MIKIDGSFGEGGGQILRSALGLSLVTGRPFTIENIRAGRNKPGLLRQHLTAVKAAIEISGAEVEGNSLQSLQLTFRPGKPRGGNYKLSVGTAGSTTLVLQSILPALMIADAPSRLTLEGGTHNPYAPPYDFLKRAFLRVVNQMGPTVSTDIKRYGFYPAGGGEFSVDIQPTGKLRQIAITEKGALHTQAAFAFSARIPNRIGHQEMEIIALQLGWPRSQCISRNVESPGPGNLVTIELDYENVTEVFTGFGEKSVRLQKVVARVIKSYRKYVESGAAVGPFLADQLLIPMAMAGGGEFITMKPTQHTLTNIKIVQQFLEIGIETTQLDASQWQIKIGG